jgi:hypothetical protein
VLASDDHALGNWLRPQEPEQVQAEPVCRGPVAAQQARSAEQQGARANRGDVPGLLPLLAQEVEQLVVIQHIVHTIAARHEQHVERRGGGVAAVADQRQPIVTNDRARTGGHEMHTGVRQAGKHFVGAGEIELRQPGKQDHADCGHSSALLVRGVASLVRYLTRLTRHTAMEALCLSGTAPRSSNRSA